MYRHLCCNPTSHSFENNSVMKLPFFLTAQTDGGQLTMHTLCNSWSPPKRAGNWCRVKNVEKCFTCFGVLGPARKLSRFVLTLSDDVRRFLTWPLSAGPFFLSTDSSDSNFKSSKLPFDRNYYIISSETIMDVNNYIPFSIINSQTIDVM